MRDRVHPDAVAQQRAAGSALGRIDRDDGDGPVLGKSSRKRRTNSSTSEDLPAPPVPVMPRTGTVVGRGSLRRTTRTGPAYLSGQFSAAEIKRPRTW